MSRGPRQAAAGREEARHIEDWPEAAYWLVAGIGLALFAFQVQDGLELVGEHLRDVRRVVLLHNLSIAISCLLLATSAFWVTRSYNKGYVVALVGLLLAVLVAINFRGDYVRMGTFDFFETLGCHGCCRSPAPWLLELRPA